MKWTAKKVKHRKLRINGVAANQLDAIFAVRTLNDERKLGQYKLVDDGRVRYFANFKELRFYSNQILRNKHKHVIIVRGEIPNDPC